MIEIKEIKTDNKELYSFAEQLMISAFPISERRDTEEQRDYADNKNEFIANIIVDNAKPIGFINYWNLEDIYYIEHFAIDTSMRNGGYGQKTLNVIKHILNDKPIVLEVELPDDEIKKRRINFYSRNGFVLQQHNYTQPPYRRGGESLPMKLMIYNEKNINLDLNNITYILHSNVYNVEQYQD